MADSYPDRLLVTLLDAINTASGGLTITLFTGGLLITGLAVSETEYYGRLDDLIRNSGESMAPWQGLFPSIGRGEQETLARNKERERELTEGLPGDAYDLPPEQRDEIRRELDRLTRRYVSLKDVTVFGAGPDPIDVPVWRGRLSEITGWTLGRLERRTG